MICNISGTVEDVQSYNGKNGFGANITISQLINKKRSLLAFIVNSSELANIFEENLQEQVNLQLELIQNNFGLRIGAVADLKVISKK